MVAGHMQAAVDSRRIFLCRKYSKGGTAKTAAGLKMQNLSGQQLLEKTARSVALYFIICSQGRENTEFRPKTEGQWGFLKTLQFQSCKILGKCGQEVKMEQKRCAWVFFLFVFLKTT